MIVFQQALGTMTFGAEADESSAHELMSAYVAAGGNFIDTADVYGAGASETIVGNWLAAHPAEARQVVVATKGRFPMGTGPNDLGASRRHLRLALEDSLRRLQVEHIDLYQVHAWDPIAPIDETLRFLNDAVTAGKIGYYGFSNSTGWQLTKAVHVADRHGWAAPVSHQPQYSLLARGIEQEIVPAALDAGIGLLPWSPLGGGWLSGKYERDIRPTGSTRLGENPNRGMEAWDKRNSSARTWRVLEEIRDVASDHEASASQVALAWLHAQPAVTAVVLGVRSLGQLTDNLGAVHLSLSSEQIDLLNAASAPEVDDYPYGEAALRQRRRKISGGR